MTRKEPTRRPPTAAISPDTAKNVQAVRTRSATASGFPAALSPRHPLDRRRRDPRIEKPEISDDGQKHDPQAVGGGAEVVEQNSGQDQSDQYAGEIASVGRQDIAN